MILKNSIFFFFPLFLILLKISQIKAKETELEKIKNVIKAMFTLKSDTTIPIFSFKFKKIIMKFINFSYFDLSSKNITIIQEDKNKYILKNITTAFKSEIEVNNFHTTKTEFLMEVCFDKIIFNNNNYFLYISEITPKSLYVSKNNQIGKLSYFNEFNNMNEKATFIDENGEKTENVDIISIFLDLSKKCLFKKVTNTQKSFNLLTYDLDKILNNIIGKTIFINNYLYDIYKISSIVITNIEIPLKSIYFEEDRLIIDKMNTTGNLFYRIEKNKYKLINFGFFNNAYNFAYFEKNYFEINLKEDNIFFDYPYPTKMGMFEILNSHLVNLIEKEVENYYS